MKLLLSCLASAVLVTGLAAVPEVAAAQTGTNSEVAVFGADPCPRSTDSNIVVCRRYPESMRYRMPEAYRQPGTKQERNSWSNKAKELSKLGNTGPNSCSAVGPGGFTGCLAQEIQTTRDANKEAAEQDQAPQQ